MIFRRLFSGQGRISRKGYWLSLLITFALFWACFIIPATISFIADKGGITSGFLFYLPGIVWYIQIILLFLFMRAVISKRLRDMNSSGWRIHILWFIPIVGWLIALIYLGVAPSVPYINEETIPPAPSQSDS